MRMRVRGFQFHKGTIRTYPFFFPGVTLYGFNSIKVRLEQICSHFALLSLLSFNSIKVRLEHPFPAAAYQRIFVSIP